MPARSGPPQNDRKAAARTDFTVKRTRYTIRRRVREVLASPLRPSCEARWPCPWRCARQGSSTSYITTAAINEEHALKIDQSHSSSSSAAGGWAQTGAPAGVATAALSLDSSAVSSATTSRAPSRATPRLERRIERRHLLTWRRRREPVAVPMQTARAQASARAQARAQASARASARAWTRMAPRARPRVWMPTRAPTWMRADTASGPRCASLPARPVRLARPVPRWTPGMPPSPPCDGGAHQGALWGQWGQWGPVALPACWTCSMWR